MTAAALHALVPWVARLFGSALVGVLIVLVYRAIGRTSSRMGTIVAAGIALRAAISAGLFFVSYLDLPLLRGLHTGDGFWSLAPDARLYFGVATGAGGAAAALGRGGASPVYTQVLSLWMQVVGVSPASGAFLNLCCYTAACWLIARVLRRREVLALATLAAFTFSPALLVFGTQSLKDIVFDLLLVVVCAGAWALLRERPAGARQLGADVAIALTIAAGLVFVAGIRAYVAVFVGLAFLVALSVSAVWPRRPGTWPRLARAALLLLVINSLWPSGRAGQVVVARTGGGSAPAAAPSRQISEDEGVVGRLARPFDRMRAGFTQSGGNTNLGLEVAAKGVSGRSLALGYGLLLTFVPFSALEWAGVVPKVGKQAFIAIADVDTIFMDCSILVIAALVARSARTRGLNRSYALFAAVLAVSLTLSLAYVVTNYGTLFRLRLMGAVPFWMMALAARRRVDGGDA